MPKNPMNDGERGKRECAESQASAMKNLKYQNAVKARWHQVRQALLRKYSRTAEETGGFSCVNMPSLLTEMMKEAHSAIIEAGGNEDDANIFVSTMTKAVTRRLYHGREPYNP